ncbi:hypothetical protein EI42_06418 [Thermosporothrix hazakensis]|uniref:Excisionase family DNA binding protein n=1 Tax=Thermosporothrix hazakensis TaxID=644383 RepID=A0A326TNE7_THEHA|nr:helix-turn-helix domain-containing protein [Thermosporothrix hazakensis]PZW18011.1 hypothetical protein EI42_06418 [Thermosporothrix hazakensis]GCE50479.1 hypothetical protein KTH_53480 [Thermosporothrix hazakensis]
MLNQKLMQVEAMNNQTVVIQALAQLQLLSIKDVCKLLQLSRPEEGLPVMHFGRSVRVSPVALAGWLNARQAQQAIA